MKVLLASFQCLENNINFLHDSLFHSFQSLPLLKSAFNSDPHAVKTLFSGKFAYINIFFFFCISMWVSIGKESRSEYESADNENIKSTCTEVLASNDPLAFPLVTFALVEIFQLLSYLAVIDSPWRFLRIY